MNDLIISLNALDEVKKYKRLETLVDSNEEYKKTIKDLFEFQKQMTNSKHYGLENNYYIYFEKYNLLKKGLEKDVLLNMYFESLEEVNQILEVIAGIISGIVNDKLL